MKAIAPSVVRGSPAGDTGAVGRVGDALTEADVEGLGGAVADADVEEIDAPDSDADGGRSSGVLGDEQPAERHKATAAQQARSGLSTRGR